MTGPPAAVVRAPFTAPFTGRARRELLFCVLGLPLSLPLPVVGFAVTIWLAQVAGMPPWTADGDPSWLALLTAAAVVVLTAALMVATGLTRALAAAVRSTAGKLLGEHVATPPRARTRLGDGPGWRAMAYLMLKLPAGLAEWYVVGVFWVAGIVNLSYPFGARQRARRRLGQPGRDQRHPGRTGRQRPGQADPGDRDDRLLLRRGAAGQRGQAQPGEHDQDLDDRTGRVSRPPGHR
jgi:hypothetical protein